MKVSILTFSKENNYGANLQCFALSRVLEQLNCLVEIIDIQLSHPKYSFSSRILYSITKFQFDRFRSKYIPVFSRRYKDSDSIISDPPKADVYIVGSDQVWNPSITQKLDPKLYFFSFLPKGSRRISYAASFGSNKWNWPEVDVYKSLLKQFSSISVREQSGINICRNIFDVEAQEVLDPTLLLDSYDNICGSYDESLLNNEIVYFHFAHCPEYEESIVRFARNHGLKPVHLKGPLRSNNGMKSVPFASVKAWLNRIRYSKFVVTGSFHCMAFSILFHRQFVTLPSHKIERTERIINLQHQLGLDDRLFEGLSLENFLEMRYNNIIEYEGVDNNLNRLRSSSLEFLKNSLCK